MLTGESFVLLLLALQHRDCANCYTVNWNIILSVRDWGNLDVGLSDNERQLKFLEELRNWHMKIIIIDFTVFTGKYYGRNLFIFNCEPW